MRYSNVVLLVLSVLLSGCLNTLNSGVRQGPVTRIKGYAQRVTDGTIWTSLQQVPKHWLHLTDGITFPVFVLQSGTMACVVDGSTFTMSQNGQYATCQWRYPH